MRKASLLAIACGVVLTAFAAPAAAETLNLNTYETPSDGLAGPVATSVEVPAGESALVKVQGTYSAFPASRWLSPFSICGTAQSSPMFPSPGRPNSKVGRDAEVSFARPVRFASSCNPSDFPIPNSTLRINSGSGNEVPVPVGGVPTGPSDDHAYFYVVEGEDEPIKVSVYDTAANDNNGVLKVSTIIEADDCKKGGWEAFPQFKNQGDCVSSAPVKGSAAKSSVKSRRARRAPRATASYGG